MIQVVLDSSIYHQNPKRDKGAFRALVRLCKSGLAQLHIPYFVNREFVTKQEAIAKEAILAVQSAAIKIARHSGQQDLRWYVETLNEESAKALKDVKKRCNQEWSDWLRECNAVEHPLSLTHGERVVESYFTGGGWPTLSDASYF